MELVAVIFMIAGGIGLAALLAITIGFLERERAQPAGRSTAIPEPDYLAASILQHLLLAGGARDEESLAAIRRLAGLGVRPAASIDLPTWGARFASISTPSRREWLLDRAVVCAMQRSTCLPLRQYNALLDLNFSLGFQTDALAKLRERYGFDYIDHARTEPPAATASAHWDHDRKGEFLGVLELNASSTRDDIVAAYRKMALRFHPDRFHTQPEEVRQEAARRFVAITHAYESLLSLCQTER